MRPTLIILSMLLSLNSFAQGKKVVLNVSPLPAIDIINFPTIQGGLELGLSERWSWMNEVGVKYVPGSNEGADTSFVSSKGFKVKTEVRYYWKPSPAGAIPGRLEGAYLAANVFYIRDRHNSTADYFTPGDSLTLKTDNFGVKKAVFGMNLLFGYQRAISDHLLVDLYAGPGVRIRRVLTINKEFDYSRDELHEPKDINLEAFKYKAEAKGGTSGFPQLTLGLRLCYKLY